MELPNTQVMAELLQEPSTENQYQDISVQKNHLDSVQNELPLIQYTNKSEAVPLTELSLETAADSAKLLTETETGNNLEAKPRDHSGSGDVTGSQETPNAVPSISRSLSERTCCRICQEDDTNEKLISPCYCTGSVGYMHFSCLEKWLQTNSRTHCELCSYPFPVAKVLPSLWKYLRSPAQNMDMPSLLCDVSCFFLLTPLLVASTYLCSVGVGHYHVVGKSESVFAVITLMISLITVYCAWATLAVLYHRRVWLTWRDKNAQIHMLTDKTQLGQPAKPREETDVEADSTATESCGITSRPESTSILLRPLLMFTKSKQPKIHKPVANTSP